MRHLRQIMGIITPIPVANDVNRDEALIRAPIPAANGANRYEAIISISEELRRQKDLLVAPSTAVKKAMDTLKPVVLDSQESDNCVSGNAEGIRAQCIIPLVNRDRVLGILCPSRTTETPFVPEDVDFLSRASGQIAIAIENALA